MKTNLKVFLGVLSGMLIMFVLCALTAKAEITDEYDSTIRIIGIHTGKGKLGGDIMKDIFADKKRFERGIIETQILMEEIEKTTKKLTEKGKNLEELTREYQKRLRNDVHQTESYN